MKDFDGDYRAAFKGEHLQAADFDKPYTVRVARVALLNLLDDSKPEERGKKKQRQKLTLFLAKAKTGEAIERSWLISKTAAKCIADMFGTRVADWKGKLVTLYRDPGVRFGTEVTGGIRVLGSPDLHETMRVKIAWKGKRPYMVTLKKTELGKEELPTETELHEPIEIPRLTPEQIAALPDDAEDY